METLQVINSFQGSWRFLSNFYPAPLEFNLLEWSSSEHAYQGSKTSISEEREWVRAARTPGEAKRRGRQVTIRKNWDNIKVPVMRSILLCKFQQNPSLRQKLLKTGNATLIEGNNFHDILWGCCNCPRHRGEGSNILGLLLMKIREEEAQCHLEMK